MIFDRFKDESCPCYYKLILMDCNMPVMDGYSACQQLKIMIKSKKIPKCNIVACTAAITDDNIIRCQQSGFDSVLAKPIVPNLLMDLI
jgi:CheY-like chemotaxis protein